MKKPLIVIGVLAVIALIAFLNIRFKKKSQEAVEVVEVKKRNISKIVTASGRIKPKRRVNVSASAIGKITTVAVKEGDYVEKGGFLLQIDPTEYRTAVEQLESGIRAAEASLAVENATLEKTKYDYNRARELFDKGFLSEDRLKDAAITLEIQKSKVKSARESMLQQRASMSKAMHDLKEVRITAEMSGIITALNVEEGENAIMGTLNNPGTVLLTIADLSEMEAEVEVDETEVIYVQPGQEAIVELDAYPDSTFSGIVTEVGNSAIPTARGVSQESVDFKVVIAIKDSIPGIRPGLSASTEITVAEIESTLAIPIQCLTVRKRSDLKMAAKIAESAKEKAADVEGDERASPSGNEEEIEGVFIVENGKAKFRKITVGISGEQYCEVKSGLKEKERVVSGPFKVLSKLKDGAAVKAKDTESP